MNGDNPFAEHGSTDCPDSHLIEMVSIAVIVQRQDTVLKLPEGGSSEHPVAEHGGMTVRVADNVCYYDWINLGIAGQDTLSVTSSEEILGIFEISECKD